MLRSASTETTVEAFHDYRCRFSALRAAQAHDHNAAA
jgi:hypothetical protein